MSKIKCVNIKINKENCSCPELECDKHGICCECMRSNSEGDVLPNCQRIKIKDSQKFREHIMNLINDATA